MDSTDIGMIQRCRSLSLIDESGRFFLTSQDCGREELQNDRPFKSGVLGSVDYPHATLA
jgi:hypothetical protein